MTSDCDFYLTCLEQKVCLCDEIEIQRCGLSHSSPRPSEQSEQRLVCSDVRSWCAQDGAGETCKAGTEISGSSPVQREEGM